MRITVNSGEVVHFDPILINISNVSGDIAHTSNYSLVTLAVGQKVHVVGSLDTPDRSFNLPIRWKGDFRLFRVDVVNKEFNFDIWFDDSGVGILDDYCVNKDLPYTMFKLNNNIQFDVVA